MAPSVSLECCQKVKPIEHSALSGRWWEAGTREVRTAFLKASREGREGWT
ncbi:Hypothetical protein BMEA_A1125 [Brucella melitensis ATCC 23457]|uniref:Uncharacterized protein n=1 Tax=Brucella melitensis biotype 2 (strain ATCC 23457) TaxID=546272 RepID=C0RGY1_BRUMB|nr:Hypothetical protein BMEA_A0294 [Brucella melitensis ATCC 23457]ACO00863.1 Hypothetical protein BMEA_A1125 [Brucella melitensis ATCC 23457]